MDLLLISFTYLKMAKLASHNAERKSYDASEEITIDFLFSHIRDCQI